MADFLQALIELAFAEDLAGGQDITSNATIPESQNSVAEFVNRAPGVIAGLDVAVRVLEYVGINDISVLVAEGQEVPAGTVLLLSLIHI